MQTLFGGVAIDLNSAPRMTYEMAPPNQGGAQRPKTAVGRSAHNRKLTAEASMFKMAAKVKPHLMLSGTSLNQKT